MLLSKKANPLDKRHPFWKATTGSILEFLIDMSALFQSLTVTVYSISRPTIYRLDVIRKDGSVHSTKYGNRKETVSYIRNCWVPIYGSNSKVNYREAINVTSQYYKYDPTKIIDPESPSSASLNSSNESVSSLSSSLSSISPTIERRHSLKVSPTRTSRPKPTSLSLNSSPRSSESSPRSPKWFRRLSRKSSPRSEESSPRGSSPETPRTYRLLKTVRFRLTK